MTIALNKQLILLGSNHLPEWSMCLSVCLSVCLCGCGCLCGLIILSHTSASLTSSSWYRSHCSCLWYSWGKKRQLHKCYFHLAIIPTTLIPTTLWTTHRPHTVPSTLPTTYQELYRPHYHTDHIPHTDHFTEHTPTTNQWHCRQLFLVQLVHYIYQAISPYRLKCSTKIKLLWPTSSSALIRWYSLFLLFRKPVSWLLCSVSGSCISFCSSRDVKDLVWMQETALSNFNLSVALVGFSAKGVSKITSGTQGIASLRSLQFVRVWGDRRRKGKNGLTFSNCSI